MASNLHLDIVSAEHELFSGPCTMVFAPAAAGEVGIMPNHSPMITRLKPGEVRVQRDDGEEESFYVNGGILEVQPHVVTVMADSALRGDALDEEAARVAKEAAEQQLAQADKKDLAHAQEQLVEAAARYRAAQKLKGKR